MKNLLLGKTTLSAVMFSMLVGVTISSNVLASDLVASSAAPSVFFFDDDAAPIVPGPPVTPDWSIVGQATAAGFGNFFLYDNLGSNNHLVIAIDGVAGFTENANSIQVGSNGDVGLANSSLYIDKSNTFVGIGTTTPEQSLHVKGLGNVLLDGPGSKWLIGTIDSSNAGNLGGGIAFRDETSFDIPFLIESNVPNNSLYLTANGIGMGTNSPESSLHIKNSSKDMLLLENSSGSNKIRRLLKMNNNGPVGFEMTDRAQGATWQFRSGSSGDFLVNYQPIPGSELTIAKDTGNLTVKGSVTANGVLLTSSKHSKTDIEPVKASDVMEKLKKVEIAEWRYKAADKNDRHISPMAEDFYALFQLGPDDKHINPNDLASVAIIAAKELQAETVSLKTENALLKEQLKQQDSKFQARLDSLEKLVTNLAVGADKLVKGDKLVLK